MDSRMLLISLNWWLTKKKTFLFDSFFLRCCGLSSIKKIKMIIVWSLQWWENSFKIYWFWFLFSFFMIKAKKNNEIESCSSLWKATTVFASFIHGFDVCTIVTPATDGFVWITARIWSTSSTTFGFSSGNIGINQLVAITRSYISF